LRQTIAKEKEMKTRTTAAKFIGGTVLGLVLAFGGNALADEPCFYKGTMFSDGSAACQAGAKYTCEDGNWAKTGMTCQDSPIVASRTCQFGGIAYSTGSASCQNGAQYRCEDGSWKTLGMTCSIGDSPIKPAPSGRTCMYEGATVSSTSTICRTGSTFLCNDGEWVNLGTLCR
jgi:hypothetical protein